MSVIELRNINKIFGNKISRVHVLKNINFSAENNQFNLVLGPSGSGKSTFLTIAGGLQKPTSGQVNIEGQPIEGLSSKDRDTLRLNKIAFILQSYNLLPYLTVKEQFVLVDKVKNKGNLDSSSLDSLLKKLGIEELQEKYPGELSGGQNQRAAIARALYTNPSIILADEPTASLDSDNVKEVGSLFKSLAKEQHKSIVVVTHDLRLVDFADKIYEILDGRMKLKE
ncbi:ABC transporter ATP-binding protein [Oenococcus oeni]|uniref:Putative hemin import ATP-binding protein HrtA n=1 Tax=Oenococcus oeni (strain ATCC BAA-331 / PSU-1) TaxID=203123 RepID=Q04FV4_OENOB|nr:ABC transporter ATP-binding protein [Oenococcus oeni]ABJ56668.1 ABC-type antimicrobial peptide transport system, ATPase component [Oenococcus oeni PSU-1]OIK68373.1 peptide ABC transporter ATP-binding protein [Oenococcus oeni]OIL15124.1 peptide ABC transporter ATP-binding protein [Oenococcus oeni]OIL29741.1 peptide ABC transporter ATP-binding protein [Oenococcus oeni]OIL81739.1 peptide ABC transporter ATP-binding protein [Oenococcus oeni]